MTGPVDPLAPLLARYFATGDADTMEEIVRQTRARLLRAARRACAPQDAEDAVQAAYHALLRRGALPDGVPPTGWLVTTVVRIAWRLRARALRIEAVARRLGVADNGPGPVERAQRSEDAARVRTAIARLPAKYRDPLVLHHLQGLSVAELAPLMGMSINTVKTRLRRGRRLLEGRLAPPAAWTLTTLWGLADLLRPAATTGGIVKANAIIATSLIGFACGAAGYALGGNARASNTARTPRRTSVLADRDKAPAKQSATPSPQSMTPAPEKEPAAPRPPDPRSEAFLRALDNAARELGASPAAVKRARLALMTANGLATARRTGNAWEDHHLAELQTEMNALSAMGKDGYLAMVALARCGYSKSMGELLARLCPPGGEAHLIRDAADPKRGPLTRVACIEALGQLDRDAPGIDAVLREVVAHNNNVAIFVAATEAAAKRSVELDLARIEQKLRDKSFRHRHVRLLRALVTGSGERAARLLRRLAQDPSFGMPGPTLDALAKIDPDLAATEAAALLDGPRKLHPMQRARLRVVAGRW